MAAPDSVGPFLLGAQHLPTGYTRLSYDVGVDKRATIVIPTVVYDTFLNMPASDLFTADGKLRKPPSKGGTLCP